MFSSREDHQEVHTTYSRYKIPSRFYATLEMKTFGASILLYILDLFSLTQVVCTYTLVRVEASGELQDHFSSAVFGGVSLQPGTYQTAQAG